MTTLTAGHISTFFDKWAPESTQLDFDNIGLLLGSKTKPVRTILTCLDLTEEVVDEAISLNCDLIVAHHPVIFRKLSRLNPDTVLGKTLYKLISADISVLAAHTNLDAAREGVSFEMANQIGLIHNEFLTHEDTSPPSGFGVIGEYQDKMAANEFLENVKIKLNCNVIRYSGKRKFIRKVAVCGGSGSFLASQAMTMGADAFITADLKYHDFFITKEPGLMLLDVGHYESESPIIDKMRNTLRDEYPELTVESTSVNTNPIQTY
ncbi:MAG: Nif3-like dinuclear metal center hexameric protein [Balneolales bacterium]